MPPALPKPRHPNQTPPALTRQRQERFLDRLASVGLVSKVCKELGIDPSMPYTWATKSESFAKRLEEAKAKGEKVVLDWYEQTADARAAAGKDDPGSTNLTMFRMKRLDPRYRDNAQINVLATGPIALYSALDEQRPQIPECPRKDHKP